MLLLDTLSGHCLFDKTEGAKQGATRIQSSREVLEKTSTVICQYKRSRASSVCMQSNPSHRHEQEPLSI